MWAGFWSGALVYAVAWLWGGRVERFGAAVLIVYSVIMVMNLVLTWEIGGVYLTARIANWARLLIFGWLCFRTSRWWPFLATAAMGLMVGVDIVGLLDPAISPRDAASARIGLSYLVDLSLLLGVGERILAGEAPASRAAWAHADIATPARRRGRMRTATQAFPPTLRRGRRTPDAGDGPDTGRTTRHPVGVDPAASDAAGTATGGSTVPRP